MWDLVVVARALRRLGLSRHKQEEFTVDRCGVYYTSDRTLVVVTAISADPEALYPVRGTPVTGEFHSTDAWARDGSYSGIPGDTHGLDLVGAMSEEGHGPAVLEQIHEELDNGHWWVRA